MNSSGSELSAAVTITNATSLISNITTSTITTTSTTTSTTNKVCPICENCPSCEFNTVPYILLLLVVFIIIGFSIKLVTDQRKYIQDLERETRHCRGRRYQEQTSVFEEELEEEQTNLFQDSKLVVQAIVHH